MQPISRPTDAYWQSGCRQSLQRSLRRRQLRRSQRRRQRTALLGLGMALAMAAGLPLVLEPQGEAARAEVPSLLTLNDKASQFTPDRISGRGLRFIADFEGFFSRPYNDPVGHCTIGYGRLLHRGGCGPADYARWGRISRATGLALLRRETASASSAVLHLVLVPLTQAQHDMLVSFAYNCGTAALQRSTLLRLLNAGSYQAAADQLLRWHKADGQSPPGLRRRRAAERRVFLYGYSPSGSGAASRAAASASSRL